MAEKIKYTRRDLKGPDEFMTTMGKAVAWARENRAKVAAAGALVVLALGGVYGTRAWFRWQEDKATRDLWPHLNRAREYLNTPTQADAEKLARLEQFLTMHVNLHPGTRSAVYARYYLGAIAFIRGNHDLSVSQFRAALAVSKEKDLMAFLVRQGLAQALEAKGDLAAASEAYREAAGAAAGELRTQAWLGQARTLALQGKKEDALTVYRRILTENPESGMKDLVEIKISQLG